MTTFGWQGVTVEAPSDWDVEALSGGSDQGYLRLVDTAMPRLEITWLPPKPSGGGTVEASLSKYLETVRKQVEKEGGAIEVERGIRLLSRRRKRKMALECFAWRGDEQAYGAAWHCEDCGRTVLAQVRGRPDEKLRPLALEILGSVEDHTAGDWALWALYGVRLEAPKDFTVSSQRLMAGLDTQRGSANIELVLSRDLEQIRLLVWSMANVLLRNVELDEWADVKLVRQLFRLRGPTREEARVHGHDGLRVRAEAERPHERVQRFVLHCLHRPFPDRLGCDIWRCETSNRIYALECQLDQLNWHIAEQVRERLWCHERGGDTVSG